MSNPYLLELPAVVSFSGGRTSGYMLRKILDAHGGQPEDLVVSFQNTGLEHEGTYEFVARVAKEWGVDIVWLEYDLDEDNKPTHRVVTPDTAAKNGEPYDRLIGKKKMLSHPRARLCTGNLKIATLESYLATLTAFLDGYTNAVGLRADEPRRSVNMLQQSDDTIERVVPLYRAGVAKGDVLAFWAEQDFDLELPLPSEILGNCVGCHLRGRGLLEQGMRHDPKLFDWWVAAETKLKTKAGAPATFRSDRPTYAKMVAGVKSQGVLFAGDDPSIPCFCTD